MSVSDNNKNRGAHGDSSSMLGWLRPSSENPPALAVGSVKTNILKVKGDWQEVVDDSRSTVGYTHMRLTPRINGVGLITRAILLKRLVDRCV